MTPPAVGSLRVAAAAPAPAGLREARRRREQAAVQWRTDHADHSDRDRLWRAYRTGCLWNARRDQPLTLQLQAALTYAEAAVPFTDGTAP